MQSFLGRLRQFLLRPSALSLSAVVAIGMLSGLIFWGGFNTGMEATNQLEFCIGCHEMRDTVFQEYKETIHYKNRSGVRAICSGLPRAEGLDAQVHPQDPGEPGAVRQVRRGRDRHAGEVRGASHGARHSTSGRR